LRYPDGVEPGVIDEIRHAAEHVPGLGAVRDVRARWLGHRLLAEAVVELEASLSLAEADALAGAFAAELLPALDRANIRVVPENRRAVDR
jgi:divalent metal cation (Fe/Co/Zn/Cd) transporter